MKHKIIAPVGQDMSALFIGIREFPTEKIILVTNQKNYKAAQQTKQDLNKFRVPVEIRQTDSKEAWEEAFRIVSEIKKQEGENLLINLATGDPELRCIYTSAAFVNGVKAFSVQGQDIKLVPVLKFSYYKLLTDKKLEILRLLNEPNCCSSLEDISKRTKMSLPLISYHINGTLKSEGLKQLGLVETQEIKGKIDVKLTTLGRLLIKSYI